MSGTLACTNAPRPVRKPSDPGAVVAQWQDACLMRADWGLSALGATIAQCGAKESDLTQTVPFKPTRRSSLEDVTSAPND